MDNTAYICAANSGNNYYYMFSILDYDDIPVVFVAKDQNDQIYLCDCVEFRDKQKWVISKTDYTILWKIATQKISVYDALSQNEGLVDFVTFNYETGDFVHQLAQNMEIMSPENLPDKNSIIRYPEPKAIQSILAFSISPAMNSQRLVSAEKIDWSSGEAKQTGGVLGPDAHNNERIHARIDGMDLVAA